MNEIRRVLRTAAWRLFLLDLIRAGIVTLSVAVVAMILVRITERLFGLTIPWTQAALIAAGAAALGALFWSIAVRRRAVAVARELDERADLRESLSTALCVASKDDGWSRAVIETAQDRATRVDVRKAIPIEAPRFWPAPLALALSLVVLWYALPPVDVLGLLAKKQEEEKAKQEIVQVKSEIQTAEKKIEELLAKAKVEPKEEGEGADAGEMNQPQSPDDIRRAAIKKLTSVQDRLNEIKMGEKGLQAETLKQMMKQLKQPGPGPLEEMSKALAKGDFQGAKEKLDELANKLANGELSPEQQKQLKEQLQKMAEQLDKLAQSQKQLEQKLQEAGMSKEQAQKAAADPQALEQALEQMKNLSEEQKQQLADMAKAMSQACQQCNNMGQAMNQMAKGMSQNGMSQEGMEGMDGLRGQLSEAEMLSQEMAALDAAMRECMGQLETLGGQCEGGNMASMAGMGGMKISPWRAGDTSRQGDGSGSPGKGWGASPEAQETAFNIEKKTSPVKLGQGPIVGSRLVEGDAIKGESVAEFAQAVEASTQAASDAIDDMLIQREYHDAVKHYFGRLEAKSKAAGEQTPAPEGSK